MNGYDAQRYERATAHATDVFFQISQLPRSRRTPAAQFTFKRRLLAGLIKRLERDAPRSHHLRQARTMLADIDASPPPVAPARSEYGANRPKPIPSDPTDPNYAVSEFARNWREVASGETYRQQKQSAWRRGPRPR